MFHSSPKNGAKVKSRGLDHSIKDFCMCFLMWFCKKNIAKTGYVRIHRLFLFIADLFGTYQGILNLGSTKNRDLE